MEEAPVIEVPMARSDRRWYRAGLAALLVVCIVTTTGWIIAARQTSEPTTAPDCYRLIGDSTIQFTATHGAPPALGQR